MTVVIRSNRGRPRPEIRRAVYEAAIAQFRRVGYAASTVDEIVAAAQVAKGTFYNFFPTKIDVLKTYYKQIDIEVARVRSALEPAKPLTALSSYVRAVEEIFLREGTLMIELLELAANEPVMRQIDSDSGACDADGFATFLIEVQTLGLIDRHIDPVLAAEAIIDLWSGAVRSWLRDPVEGGLVKPFEARMKLLFQGMGHGDDAT